MRAAHSAAQETCPSLVTLVKFTQVANKLVQELNNDCCTPTTEIESHQQQGRGQGCKACYKAQKGMRQSGLTCGLKLEEERSLPTVTHPGRMFLSPPNSSSLRLPIEKCSMMR